MIIFGKKAKLSVNWKFPRLKQAEHGKNIHSYVISLRERLGTINDLVKKNLQTAIARQTDYYNKNRLERQLNSGDKVLVRCSRNKNKEKKYSYIGPNEKIGRLDILFKA